MPSGAGCLSRWNDFVSTSEPYPLYNAFRGTLPFEVNFTDRVNHCEKYLRGRLSDLVKFTFRADPLQKALKGTLPFEVNFTGWQISYKTGWKFCFVSEKFVLLVLSLSVVKAICLALETRCLDVRQLAG